MDNIIVANLLFMQYVAAAVICVLSWVWHWCIWNIAFTNGKQVEYISCFRMQIMCGTVCQLSINICIYILLRVSFSKSDGRYYFLLLSVNFRINGNGGAMLIFFCRVRSEDSGVMGLRYGSENLSLGASFVPFPCMHLFTITIWFIQSWLKMAFAMYVPYVIPSQLNGFAYPNSSRW